MTPTTLLFCKDENNDFIRYRRQSISRSRSNKYIKIVLLTLVILFLALLVCVLWRFFFMDRRLEQKLLLHDKEIYYLQKNNAAKEAIENFHGEEIENNERGSNFPFYTVQHSKRRRRDVDEQINDRTKRNGRNPQTEDMGGDGNLHSEHTKNGRHSKMNDGRNDGSNLQTSLTQEAEYRERIKELARDEKARRKRADWFVNLRQIFDLYIKLRKDINSPNSKIENKTVAQAFIKSVDRYLNKGDNVILNKRESEDKRSEETTESVYPNNIPFSNNELQEMKNKPRTTAKSTEKPTTTTEKTTTTTEKASTTTEKPTTTTTEKPQDKTTTTSSMAATSTTKTKKTQIPKTRIVKHGNQRGLKSTHRKPPPVTNEPIVNRQREIISKWLSSELPEITLQDQTKFTISYPTPKPYEFKRTVEKTTKANLKERSQITAYKQADVNITNNDDFTLQEILFPSKEYKKLEDTIQDNKKFIEVKSKLMNKANNTMTLNNTMSLNNTRVNSTVNASKRMFNDSKEANKTTERSKTHPLKATPKLQIVHTSSKLTTSSSIQITVTSSITKHSTTQILTSQITASNSTSYIMSSNTTPHTPPSNFTSHITPSKFTSHITPSKFTSYKTSSKFTSHITPSKSASHITPSKFTPHITPTNFTTLTTNMRHNKDNATEELEEYFTSVEVQTTPTDFETLKRQMEEKIDRRNKILKTTRNINMTNQNENNVTEKKNMSMGNDIKKSKSRKLTRLQPSSTVTMASFISTTSSIKLSSNINVPSTSNHKSFAVSTRKSTQSSQTFFHVHKTIQPTQSKKWYQPTSTILQKHNGLNHNVTNVRNNTQETRNITHEIRNITHETRNKTERCRTSTQTRSEIMNPRSNISSVNITDVHKDLTNNITSNGTQVNTTLRSKINKKTEYEFVTLTTEATTRMKRQTDIKSTRIKYHTKQNNSTESKSLIRQTSARRKIDGLLTTPVTVTSPITILQKNTSQSVHDKIEEILEENKKNKFDKKLEGNVLKFLKNILNKLNKHEITIASKKEKEASKENTTELSWKCRNMTTSWGTDYIVGTSRFLSNHKIQCSNDEFLQEFQLVDNKAEFFPLFRYNYKCCRLTLKHLRR